MTISTYSDAFATVLLAAASLDAAISFTAATRKFEQLPMGSNVAKP